MHTDTPDHTITILQRGFTLIELMLIVTLIGILTAIAIPLYHNFILRTQLTRAYSELRSNTNAIETILTFGNTPTLDPRLNNQPSGHGYFEYLNIGNSQSTSNILTNTSLQETQNHIYSLSASINGQIVPEFQGTKITLNRSADGNWTCQIHPGRLAADKIISLGSVGDCSMVI